MLISKHLIIILKISFVCYSFSGTELGPFLKKIKADHNDWHTGRKTIWVKMHGKEYHVPNEPTYINQSNAQAYCKSQGGILFEPKSSQVNIDIANLAKGNIRQPWIWLGIHECTSSKGNFAYESDGQSIDWKNWKTGQPDGDGEENCVALQTITDSYDWSDVDCDGRYNFICERGKSTILMHNQR